MGGEDYKDTKIIKINNICRHLVTFGTMMFQTFPIIILNVNISLTKTIEEKNYFQIFQKNCQKCDSNKLPLSERYFNKKDQT